jgi:DNA-binding transcriptional LysR family regulator
MTMNLNQLRVFRAVLEEGSITRAARALRISQPAVSKQLAELEVSLGTSLVDRLPRGIRLTAAGELLSDHVRRIFQEERAAELAIAEFLGLRQGQLSVGASTTIGSYLVPRVFGDFRVLHPKVALELSISNTRTIQNRVLEAQLDVGLTEGFASSDALEIEVLSHDEMVLIVAPEDPLAKRSSISVQQLPELPFIVRERGSGTRDVIEASLYEHGVVRQPVMTLGSTEAVKNAVARGLGVAIVSRLTVALELSAGHLIELPVEGLKIRRALHLLTLKGKHPGPAAREFLRLLRLRFSPKKTAED